MTKAEIAAATGPYPPGFDGEPFLYMGTIFSLMLVNLLAAEWLWRLCWNLVEDKVPFKHPVTFVRVILASLLIGAMVRSGPDLVKLAMWENRTPLQRVGLEHFDARLDSIAFIFMSLAWLAARLGEPMLRYQLSKHPPALHLWPTWRDLVRPLKIGGGVFVIAFALTFLR